MRNLSRLRWVLLILIVASPFLVVFNSNVRAVPIASGLAPDSPDALNAQGLSVSVTDWHDPLCATHRQRYTIVVRNDGATTALTGVRLHDDIPVLYGYPRLDESSPGAVYDGVGTVTWEIGVLLAGESATRYLELGTYSTIPDGTVMVNSVTAESDQEGPVSATAQTTVLQCVTPSPSPEPTATLSPGLFVSKSDRIDPICATYTETYDIYVENTGNVALTGIMVWDTVPEGAYYVDASSGGGYDGINTVTWNVGTLQPGESVDLWLQIRTLSTLPDGTIIVNTVTVDSAETAPVTRQEQTTVVLCTSATPTPGPGLSIRKVDMYDPWCAGWNQHYDLYVTNSFGTDLTGVVVVDAIPTGTSFLWADNGGTYNGAGQVTWNLGTLLAHTTIKLSLEIRISATLPNDTIITNVATADSNETGQASDSEDTLIQQCIFQTPEPTPRPPVLEISKTDAHDPHCIKGKQKYTIVITNTGGSPATGMVITDIRPLGTYPLLDESTPGWVYDGIEILNFYPGILEPHQPLTLTLEMGTNSWLQEGWQITNTVMLECNELPPVWASEMTTLLVCWPDPTATATLTPTATATPTATVPPTPTATIPPTIEPSTPTPTVDTTRYFYLPMIGKYTVPRRR